MVVFHGIMLVCMLQRESGICIIIVIVIVATFMTIIATTILITTIVRNKYYAEVLVCSCKEY